MKLYATTSTERASKGQGGNKYLHIKIQVGNDRYTIAELMLTRSDGNVGLYTLTCNGKTIAERVEVPESSQQIKGKRQKGVMVDGDIVTLPDGSKTRVI